MSKKNINRISSPEDLSDYIRVSSPSIWVVLIAIVVLMAGVLIWGYTGSLPSTINNYATFREGELVACIPVEESEALHEGALVLIDGRIEGRIKSILPVPMSRDEIMIEVNSDYVASALIVSDWNTVVLIEYEGDLNESKPYPVTITTEEVSPVSFLFGGGA